MQVVERVRANAGTGAGTITSVIKKGVLIMASQAVLDGTCVYLFAGMLCHLINVN